MKRFKIKFPIGGEEKELYVEVMDTQNTRFAVTREMNDPQPLIIEVSSDGGCELRSENSWPLSEDDLSKLAQELRSGGHEPFETGIHAT